MKRVFVHVYHSIISMKYLFLLSVFVFILLAAIFNYKKRERLDPVTGLTLPHFSACLKPRPRFSSVSNVVMVGYITYH